MNRKKWKICIDDPFPGCEYVYPIQQRGIKFLYDQAKDNPNVLKMVIFGSSITPRCHMGSDIDVYYELREDKRLGIHTDFTFIADTWTNFMVDDRLLAEIKSTGMTIFEREE